ncbi:MAG: Thiol-disulfide oxidoreductase ResA [Saprospiraceae bacterium]|jgi:thiol-disulfide isomerase/thioredoxin|nr:Thiol-disulfide oxidoreductase ResA [Saprospiraceae bacterium]
MNTLLLPRFTLYFVISLLLSSATSGIAQEYRISVKINGYENDTLLLGYYFGDKQYIKDTAYRMKNGSFIFKRDTTLPAGMYLVVTKPDHNFFQILVDEDRQKFGVETEFTGLNEKLSFSGSKLNYEFNAYIDFLGAQRKLADSLSALLRDSSLLASHAKFRQQLDELDEGVQLRQQEILKTNPKSLLSLIIRWSRDVSMPDFSTWPDGERESRMFAYYKTHYFDEADFKDDRIVRLPLFFQKVDRYIQNLTVQHPDSISASLDDILSRLTPGSESHKFILSHYLNSYAASRFVGMDAVYVHLVENYYAKGLAPWIETEQLSKMIKDAKALKPLLIDKPAPDIRVFRLDDSTPVNLHGISSPYTVLIFWAPDCGHCKKSLPTVKAFHQKFKDKGVEVVTVCTQLGSDAKNLCMEQVKLLEMNSVINLYDPTHSSKFKLIYDLKTTPQIYILDEHKKILTKKIGAEQLGEVMDKLLSIKNE